jgi:hypothetical protein
MRCAIVSVLVMICACTFVQAKGGGEAAPPMAQPRYRVGKAPKPEFKVGGKSCKVNPESKSTKQVRALPSEHFDPTTRHQRVETFYREALKDHHEDTLHGSISLQKSCPLNLPIRLQNQACAQLAIF